LPPFIAHHGCVYTPGNIWVLLLEATPLGNVLEVITGINGPNEPPGDDPANTVRLAVADRLLAVALTVASPADNPVALPLDAPMTATDILDTDQETPDVSSVSTPLVTEYA
jgi:hypothetical protein